jgi:zinc D-Ala-D-Ala carboxypeptidase
MIESSSSLQLSEHFTLEEFTHSERAARDRIDNTLPDALYPVARQTCELLEQIRRLLGKIAQRNVPLIVTSGYRCLALNRAIGSVDGSDHVRGQAADFRAPAFGTPTQVARAIAPHIDVLGVGQLINEFPDRGGWVHVSTRTPPNPANRVLTISGAGTVAGLA